MKTTQAKSLLSNRVFKTVILIVITFLAGYFFHVLLQQSQSDLEHVHTEEQATEQPAQETGPVDIWALSDEEFAKLSPEEMFPTAEGEETEETASEEENTRHPGLRGQPSRYQRYRDFPHPSGTFRRENDERGRCRFW